MSFDWGSLIGAAVSLYGSKKQSDAAKDAGNQSAQGAQASNDLLKYFYDQDAARQQPFYQNGLTAQSAYMQMLGLTPYGAGGTAGGGATSPGGPAGRSLSLSDAVTMQNGAPIANAQLYASDPAYKAAWDGVYQHHYNESGTTAFTNQTNADKIRAHVQQLYGQYNTEHPQNTGIVPPAQAPASTDPYAQFRNSPGYQFGLDEGNKSVQASAAARGGLNSGATLKALQKFGTDYADQQGFTPYMNRLASLWGGAQTAASAMGSAGQSYGNQMGQNLQNAANARAQSTYDSANAWANGLGNAWAYGNKAYQSYRNGGE